MLKSLTLGTAILVMTGMATADTAYVKPSDFTPATGQTITVEVAFSDFCCEPRYPVRTDAYTVITPDGIAAPPDRVEMFATTTVLQHVIHTDGTTRISTGERLGRKGEYVQLDGGYFLVNSPDAELTDIPAGTPILTSQTATVSDAYVTAGGQDWGAIRSKIGRLALTPAIHPNTAQVGSPFIARVTFDGEPVARQSVSITNEFQRLFDTEAGFAESDAEGLVSFVFEHPGTHVIMVRKRAPAPAGSETDIRSYTTALTLSVKPE